MAPLRPPVAAEATGASRSQGCPVRYLRNSRGCATSCGVGTTCQTHPAPPVAVHLRRAAHQLVLLSAQREDPRRLARHVPVHPTAPLAPENAEAARRSPRG